MTEENNYNQVLYPVVTGSNGELQISYRLGKRNVITEGENVSVPVEARPTLCGHDIFFEGKHVSSVTEKDSEKVGAGPLDYYVRRWLEQESVR